MNSIEAKNGNYPCAYSITTFLKFKSGRKNIGLHIIPRGELAVLENEKAAKVVSKGLPFYVT